jgi:hypothetical protein
MIVASRAVDCNVDSSPNKANPPLPWTREPGHQYAFHFGNTTEFRSYKADGTKRVWYDYYLGKGEWKGNLKGIDERPLYKRQSLVAAPPGAEIFIVEGPNKVELLTQVFGVLATTNPMGASKWRHTSPDDLALFRGQHAVIFPDNDRRGRDHAEEVARSLAPIIASVKVVQLPGLPP